jgi:hypothetical protein
MLIVLTVKLNIGEFKNSQYTVTISIEQLITFDEMK